MKRLTNSVALSLDTYTANVLTIKTFAVYLKEYFDKNEMYLEKV